jgi:hypothetical protein
MGKGALGATVAVAVLAAARTTALAQQPAIALQASAAQVRSGTPITLSGQASDVPAGAEVELAQAPYPFTSFSPLATATPDQSGSFSFTVSPALDTRYQVTLSGTTAQASVQIGVTGRLVISVKALPLGRAAIRVVVFHPAGLHWGSRRVQWWFAEGYGNHFRAAPHTTTRYLGPNAIALHTTSALPAGHFRWRACFHADDDQALVNEDRPPDCDGRGYEGYGNLPFGYPSMAAIQRAESYLNSTGGHTALAVVTSEGREYGVRIHDRFITGSLVKAMLLVAYLRRLDAIGQHYIDPTSNSILYPMINVSDNNAATQCWSIVGNSGLYAVARAAGMTDFSVDTSASWGAQWGAALLSAADQAKFFFEMDSLIPKEFVGYARYLLSTIAGYESWGIAAVARPLGYQVFFKAGWRPSPDIFLVNQAARLEGHGLTFSMAVMTDGDNGMGDGIDKIQGTTAALLSAPPPKHVGHLDPRALLNG